MAEPLLIAKSPEAECTLLPALTTLWDVFGEQGHPVRTTISDLGPLQHPQQERRIQARGC